MNSEEIDSVVTTDGESSPVDNSNIGTSPKDDGEPGREHTRSKMAILFVLGFFALLFLCIAYADRVNASLSDLKDILVAIIGALSGTLGFIVGYYYKSVQEK